MFDDEADAAGVVLVARVIKALLHDVMHGGVSGKGLEAAKKAAG